MRVAETVYRPVAGYWIRLEASRFRSTRTIRVWMIGFAMGVAAALIF